MQRKLPPVGPLALVLRRGGAGRGTVLVMAALVCTALLTGIGLLLTG
ncbi:hypothetical protein ACFZAU_37320 [Streptomyces sp. NPDC008238]